MTDTNWSACYICQGDLPDDYEYATCCSGRECGCMGMPIEVPICSYDCERLNGRMFMDYSIEVNIKSWYPAWLVKLIVKYKIWRN